MPKLPKRATNYVRTFRPQKISFFPLGNETNQYFLNNLQAKMGHGLKVARVNKVFQIEDELTQTGFEEARPAPVEEDDQVDR